MVMRFAILVACAAACGAMLVTGTRMFLPQAAQSFQTVLGSDIANFKLSDFNLRKKYDDVMQEVLSGHSVPFATGPAVKISNPQDWPLLNVPNFKFGSTTSGGFAPTFNYPPAFSTAGRPMTWRSR
jgi:hypothetical protein